jgi:hypothetical protein
LGPTSDPVPGGSITSESPHHASEFTNNAEPKEIIMVTKRKSTSEKEVKKGRVKVGKLKLNKETIKDLTDSEQKRAKGGIRGVTVVDGTRSAFPVVCVPQTTGCDLSLP